jgi:HEAT repeat protein/S1-C subfamily serine protease
MIRYSCPKCGVNLKSADDKVGARTACPRCGEHVTVPGAGRDDEAQEPVAKGKGGATGKKPVALYAGIGVAVLAVIGIGVAVTFSMSSGSKTATSVSSAQVADVVRPRRTAAPTKTVKPAAKPQEEQVAEAVKPKTPADSETPPKRKGRADTADEAPSKPAPQKPEEPPPDQTTGARTMPDEFMSAPNAEQIYKDLLKSTVLIIQVGADGNSGHIGSGSLIDKKNKLVLTNFHVVDGASKIMVFFPTYRNGELLVEKDEYLKKMLKENLGIPGFKESDDKKVDLALVRLAGLPESGVQQIPLAHHSVAPGQRLYSVGNPGVGQSFFIMTSGTARSYPHHVSTKILKAKDSTEGLELNATVVESQSPINPGDSGGPVVNDRGELVAVTESTAMQASAMSMFIDVSEIRKFRDAYYKAKHIAKPDEAPATSEVAHDLPSLMQAIRDHHSASRRASACDQLASMGPEAKNAVPDLIELIQDKDDIVRTRALKALSEIGFISQGDLPKIIEAMKDPRPDVRLQAILVIRHMGEEANDAVSGLKDRLKDDSPDVREEAAKTLGNLGPLATTAVSALGEALSRDKKHEVRQEVALAIGNILAVATIRSDDPATPAAVASGAAALEAALSDPVRDVRLSALQALEKLGPGAKMVLPKILRELKEKDREMRGQAVDTLGAIGPDAKEAAGTLAEIVVGDKELRVRAGQALGKLKKPAVPYLIKLLAIPSPTVRRAGIEALGDIGPDAGPLAARALSVLYQKETDKTNRELLPEAVKKILDK